MSYDHKAQSMPAPSAPTGKQPGWFGRNWMWFVPLLISPFCLCGICAGGMYMFVMNNAGMYMDSFQQVQSSQLVQQEIGGSITQVPMATQISNNSENGVSTSECTYTVEGSKGTATVHAVGQKSGDSWTYKEHTVTVESSGKVIDLIKGTVSEAKQE